MDRKLADIMRKTSGIQKTPSTRIIAGSEKTSRRTPSPPVIARKSSLIVPVRGPSRKIQPMARTIPGTAKLTKIAG